MYTHSTLIGMWGEDYGYIKDPAPAHDWPYQLSSFAWFVSKLRAHCETERFQRSRSHDINFSPELALLLGKRRQGVLHLCAILVSKLYSLLNQVPLPPAEGQSCRVRGPLRALGAFRSLKWTQAQKVQKEAVCHGNQSILHITQTL